jgi:hypothetical protein
MGRLLTDRGSYFSTIDTWGARLSHPIEDRLAPNSDLPKLQGCRTGLGHSVVLVPGASAYADGSNNFAVNFQRNATGEDHDLSIIRSMDSKELTA